MKLVLRHFLWLNVPKKMPSNGLVGLYLKVSPDNNSETMERKTNKMNDEQFEQFSIACRLYDEKRYTDAFKIFMKLARQGDTSGMTRVASMYGAGLGVNYSLGNSITWDMKAAELGDTVALFNLGVSYRRNGDVRSAKEWFEKALKAGYGGEAALELAKMYLISELEIQKTLNYLRIAVDSNNICEEAREEAEQLLSELEQKQT